MSLKSSNFASLVRSACTVTALALCVALPAAAQTLGNGNIAGRVTDPSGAAVPGATVIVRNEDTNVSRTLTTNKAGEYTAPFLLPGHYEVNASAPSFGKYDRKDILVTVGAIVAIDAALPADTVSTAITVTSDAPLIDTAKTEVSQTLDQDLVGSLPVVTRNYNAFVLLTPNVTPDGTTGLISFHGISGLYNQNYVDGANNNQMLFSEARGRSSGAPYVYSIDSIKEFQAETSNYSVEFGQAAGGQVNAVTKSGTNQIHGDLFYYLRYPALNALDPYSKYVGRGNSGSPNPFLLSPPVHQQNQFGGSVGGPIIKDRLFLFFTYDGFRRVGKALYSNSNIISLTPSGATTSTTTVTPTQCPTTITSTQCTNVISFLIAQAFQAPTRFSKQNLFFPRLDWHISKRNDAFVDYNFDDFDSTNGYSTANTFTNSSPSTNGPTSYHERFLVGGLTTQIGKASVNQIHVQWGPRSRNRRRQRTRTFGCDWCCHLRHAQRPAPYRRAGRAPLPVHRRLLYHEGQSHPQGRWRRQHRPRSHDQSLPGVVAFYSYGDSTTLANFQDYAADAFAGQPGDTDAYAGYHYNTFVQTVDVVKHRPGHPG